MTAPLEPTPVARSPRLGWRVAHRPPPGFAHVLGATAGAFAVVAVIVFVVEVTSNDPTAPGVGFDLALVVAALVLGSRSPGPVRSACVTVVVLTVPLVWFFAFVGNGQGAGRDEFRGIYLLTFGSYLLLYLLGWTRARSVFLAGTLLFFAIWITFEVAGGASNTVIPFQSQVSSSTGSSGAVNIGGTSTNLGSGGDTTDSTETVALIVGLAYLGAGAVLDRKQMAGAATPFIAVGGFETIVGAVVLGGNESVLLGGLLAVVAGAVVGLVGAHGENRRATTWIGGLTVFGGLVAIIVDIAPTSAAGVGGIAAAFAVALGVVAWRLAPALGELDDGDGNLRVPPSAPPGSSSAASAPV